MCNQELIDAIKHVRSLIVEAAECGFDIYASNWPERLYASQAITKAALDDAEQKAMEADKFHGVWSMQTTVTLSYDDGWTAATCIWRDGQDLVKSRHYRAAAYRYRLAARMFRAIGKGAVASDLDTTAASLERLG